MKTHVIPGRQVEVRGTFMLMNASPRPYVRDAESGEPVELFDLLSHLLERPLGDDSGPIVLTLRPESAPGEAEQRLEIAKRLLAAFSWQIAALFGSGDSDRDKAARKAAWRLFATDEVEVDNDAATSLLEEDGPDKGAAWVSVWMFVPAAAIEAELFRATVPS